MDLEEIAMAYPVVAIAAFIAVAHPKWDERPMLVVVKEANYYLICKTLLLFFEGKMIKNCLREQFEDLHLLT
jgi:3-(methylthio)propionyl---CoA ligase